MKSVPSPIGAVRPGPRPPGRLLDLGSCEPFRAQTYAESVAVSVARGEAPDTLLLCRPDRPYVSIGFHQVSSEELDVAELRRRDLPVIRRVTGGGTTFLDPSQVFYQLIYRALPGSGLTGGPSDFATALEAPLALLQALGLPARLRPPSDLVISGRKVSGNAGGTWEGAQLLVGGLLGTADVGAMAGILRCPSEDFRAFVAGAMDRALTGLDRELPYPLSPERLCQRLRSSFEERGPWTLLPGVPLREEEERFLNGVLPRHRNPSWVHLPPLPRSPSPIQRAIRVAGERYCLLVEAPGDGECFVLADSGRVESAFRAGPSYRGGPPGEPVPPGGQAWEELQRQVRSWAGT